MMDLDTENKLAAMLMKEAAELRRQAEKDGVGAYLQKPNVRGRPNSRFLTATVLGVQQANRAVEVNEMWRVRQKEHELDARIRDRSRHGNSSSRPEEIHRSSRSTGKKHAITDSSLNACSSSTRSCNSTEDGGLKDEDIEEFLHSRVKRGRGAIGSRMDETGPYLPPQESMEMPSTGPDAWENRVVLGPKKPSSMISSDDSDDEIDRYSRPKRAKRARSRSSDKDSRKHKKKERSRDKKKKSTDKRGK